MDCASFFSLEPEGNILFLTPTRNLGDLDLMSVSESCQAIVERFTETGCRHVVLDLGSIDYFGSTALGLFVRLWSKVSQRGGKMVVCDASDNEKTILRHTRLDTIWPVVTTRDDAVQWIEAAMNAAGE